MTLVEAHLAKASHNYAALRYVMEADCYPDWVACVALYTGLHYVDAVLAHDEVSYDKDHGGRKVALFGDNRYKHIRKNYLKLYNAARIARYHVAEGKKPPPFSSVWPKKRLETVLVSKYLLGGVCKSAQNLCGFDIITAKVHTP